MAGNVRERIFGTQDTCDKATALMNIFIKCSSQCGKSVAYLTPLQLFLELRLALPSSNFTS